MKLSKATETGKRIGRRAARRAAALATSPLRAYPDFLLIGVKRGGTTSLQHYLAQHPQIASADVGKGSHYFDVNHGHSDAWFRSHFPTRTYRRYYRLRHGRPLVAGEASAYYHFHPLAIERIAETLPGVKLLLLLRDPVKRAWSHYHYERARGFEDLPFEEALDREPARLADSIERMRRDSRYDSFTLRHHAYLSRGHYVDQVKRVHALIPPERLLIIRSEDLFADAVGVVNSVSAFLGVDAYPPPDIAAQKAVEYGAMPPAIRQRLAAYYDDWNRRLYDYLGRDFGWIAPGPVQAEVSAGR